MNAQIQNAQAVSTLLSQLGISFHTQRLLELSGGKITPRFIRRLFVSHGETVRPVAARAADFAHFQLPALVLLSSGEFCILSQVRGQNAVLSSGLGDARQLTIGELAACTSAVFERGSTMRDQGSYLRCLWNLFVSDSQAVLRVGLVSIAVAGLGLLAPWLTRKVMAGALFQRSSDLLATLACALLAVSLLRVWLLWLRARGRLAIETHLAHESGRFLFRRVGRLPYQEVQRRGFGELLQVLGSAEVLTRTLCNLGLMPLVEIVSAGVSLLVLLSASQVLGVVMIGLTLLTACGVLLMSRRYVALQAEELTESARARARLHELITGIATIKVEQAQRAGMLRWLLALLSERGSGLNKEFTEAWLGVWLMAIERVGRIGALAFAAFEVMAQRMTVPDLVYLGMLSETFLFSMGQLCRAIVTLSSARTHLSRVDDFLSVPPLACQQLGAVHRDRAGAPAIQLSDVWFRHGPEQPWVLQGYNLTLRRGEHLDLRGHSGMGKTTILRLVAGLYRPERGTVAVHGRDSFQDSSSIAYLPQHAQLLSGSLRDNLTHLSGANLERIAAACVATGLETWLASLPMGLETVVAGGGANLSGGQRQWIVLTAAVASERTVLLMDESLSQMDHVARSKLSLTQLFADKTVLRVTHDV